MIRNSNHISRDVLRYASSAFSRRVFKDIIDFHDFSSLRGIASYIPISLELETTFLDLFRDLYRLIRKHYCCEYVYKNEFLSKVLISSFGTRDTVVFNEFRVFPSIADIAVFNGESKAFEIKTEYDSPSRLRSQMESYRNFFDKCYLIVPESNFPDYLPHIDENVGILLFSHCKNSINIRLLREACQNENICPEMAMKTLRSSEYKSIISTFRGKLPDVSCFDMYDSCLEIMRKIPSHDLRRMILKEIKKRGNHASYLRQVPSELRQIALSLNLSPRGISDLKNILSQQYSIN